ncbi:MAG: FMN-binding protein [Sediminispirochaetaceae bacterium]
MKKLITAIGLIAAVLLLSGCGSIREMQEFSQTVVFTDPQLQDLEDGLYTGEFEKGLVAAEVEVQVRDHAIEAIEILRHDNGRGRKAERIVDDVITRQSLQVDVISGATYSSKVILKAVENALTPSSR